MNKELKEKSVSFCYFFRLPSQSKFDFEKVLENLEFNFNHMAEKNPIMLVVPGYFNANSKSACYNDSTNFEILKIDFLTFSFGFHQITKEPINRT